MNIDTIHPITKLQLKGLSTILADGYEAIFIQDSDVFNGELMVWLDNEEVCAHIGINGTVDYSF